MTDEAAPTEERRRVRRLETGWRFHRDDVEAELDDSGDSTPGPAKPSFDDGGWEPIEVPHDWSIEGPFEPDNPSGAAGGFAPEGVGWYRRELPQDLDADGRVILRLDGVMRNYDVYVDGEHVGHRPYGYSTVHYGLSDFDVTGGETLAIRVANDEYPHSRWYTGSGIYRDVHLIETDAVAVAPNGVDVRTPSVADDRAEVRVLTEVVNVGPHAADCRLETEIVDADGTVVATVAADERIDADASETVDQRLTIEDPDRWTLDDPDRYHVRSVVHRDGNTVDDVVTPFGVRTFEWTADGFFLNGDAVTLKGVNLHHDGGCLGAATTERAVERRLEILQEMGCNAIRTGHTTPQPALLDLCDRMGFLVVDEAFDKWRHEGADRWFEEWWRADLAAMIERDRNHPSVVCWSVGNENYDQGDESMLADLEKLTDAAREMDPTRPVTYGNPPWGDGTKGVIDNVSRVAEYVDVLACNYQEHWYDDLRAAGVDLPIIGSEVRPYFRGSGDDPLAFVPENPWHDAERADVCGGFVWAGFDYLGEAREWPSKGWPAGLVDTTGEIKPIGRFHQAAWADEPTVFAAAVDPDRERADARPPWRWPPLAEHWTFPDRAEDEFVAVTTFTNADAVELRLNDERLGSQPVPDDAYAVDWQVPYEPGTLRAVAREDGAVVAEHELVTAGEPAGVDLRADRERLAADGRDLVTVRATVVDGDGVRVPGATHEVRFDVAGAGEIAGVDDGNLDSDEPWVADRRSAFRGTCIAVVQAARDPGSIDVAAEAAGLEGDSVTVAVEEGGTR